MSFRQSNLREKAIFTLDNYLPDYKKDKVVKDLISGLTCGDKHVSCVYFYDEVGSKLFEKITHLPEYYLTRIEKDLLKEVSRNIGGTLANTDIVEFGSGDCSKITIILHSVPAKDIESIRYIPFDVSQPAIEEAAKSLVKLFPGLAINGIVADFTEQLSRVPVGVKRLFCFLGSTIGNFSRNQSITYLENLCKVMREDDTLLVGFDMVKNKGVLEKAYNDSSLVTEEFNKNILKVTNALVGTNFDPNTFEHIAFYNEEKSRIEMHLKALKDLEISCPDYPDKIRIETGDTIHTENSQKYTWEQIEELTSKAGLAIGNRYTDENKWYSLIQLHKE